VGFLCTKCSNGMNTYAIDGTKRWRPHIIKYETDLEDEDYILSKSECEDEEVHNLITETKVLWNNVWAYCADSTCKTCHKNANQNEEVKESQELEGSANDWNQVNQVKMRNINSISG